MRNIRILEILLSFITLLLAIVIFYIYIKFLDAFDSSTDWLYNKNFQFTIFVMEAFN